MSGCQILSNSVYGGAGGDGLTSYFGGGPGGPATGGGVEYLGSLASFSLTNCSVANNLIESGGGGIGAPEAAGETPGLPTAVVSILRAVLPSLTAWSPAILQTAIQAVRAAPARPVAPPGAFSAPV